jgi:hypothetical protein
MKPKSPQAPSFLRLTAFSLLVAAWPLAQAQSAAAKAASAAHGNARPVAGVARTPNAASTDTATITTDTTAGNSKVVKGGPVSRAPTQQKEVPCPRSKKKPTPPGHCPW